MNDFIVNLFRRFNPNPLFIPILSSLIPKIMKFKFRMYEIQIGDRIRSLRIHFVYYLTIGLRDGFFNPSKVDLLTR